jgi:hypothetical protein
LKTEFRQPVSPAPSESYQLAIGLSPWPATRVCQKTNAPTKRTCNCFDERQDYDADNSKFGNIEMDTLILVAFRLPW